jgi:hypothetical protein
MGGICRNCLEPRSLMERRVEKVRGWGRGGRCWLEGGAGVWPSDFSA